jgi:HD-GYP domain-containing protein (c-di-GMP phosphodiesterase class II)
VARIADDIAGRLGFEPGDRRRLRRAALLHDIGKLGVPNTILDKPGKLDEHEMALVRRHTGWTAEILGRVSAFASLAADAAAHHERLDGTGYHLGLPRDELTAAARVLAVADVAEALSADRPYRPALAHEQIAAILRADAGVGLCADAVDALLQALDEGAALLAA